MNVKGLGGAGALGEPIDLNRSFPVMSTFSIVLAALEFFLAHARFQISCVLLWIWVETCVLAICMTTFATNLVSCSAVKINVLFVLDCGRMFWLTVAAYVFWLLTTCCLNACFFVFRIPFV